MFTALPLLPPPPSTLLPSSASPFAPSYATESSTTVNANAPLNHVQQQQAQQQRRPKHPNSSSRNNTLSLAALSLDERLLEARKRAISMYGYGWLRPAGCGKTMLGRREEELEREEVERQLREVEEQEAMALAGEEELRRQAVLDRGEVQDPGERDLDEEIPDADDMLGENAADGDERDMDDDVPDGDDMDRTNMTFGTVTTGHFLEGETGITDDVEGTNLEEPGPAVSNSFREFDTEEQEALANAMLDEDEQGMAERDLDDDVPEATSGMMGERDLDDEVPEADDGEGEWQHTDTEEEEGMDDDDSQDEDEGAGMDISNLDQSGMMVQPQGIGITPGQSSVVMDGQTPDGVSTTGSGRRWFTGGARRNLFGSGTGNLFGLTPPQQTQSDEVSEVAAPRRRSGRRGLERENRARDSLD